MVCKIKKNRCIINERENWRYFDLHSILNANKWSCSRHQIIHTYFTDSKKNICIENRLPMAYLMGVDGIFGTAKLMMFLTWSRLSHFTPMVARKTNRTETMWQILVAVNWLCTTSIIYVNKYGINCDEKKSI